MIGKNWILAAGLLLALPKMSLAADRKELHVDESVEIAAPPAKVWSLVKDWNGLQKWHPAFSNTEIESGKNNTVGALRVVTMASSGAKFKEELLGFNEKGRTFNYRFVGDTPLPVADYSAAIQVKPGKAKGSSVLSWKGKFKRKVADNPPEGQDDEGVRKVIAGAYQAGLQNARKLAETK